MFGLGFRSPCCHCARASLSASSTAELGPVTGKPTPVLSTHRPTSSAHYLFPVAWAPSESFGMRGVRVWVVASAWHHIASPAASGCDRPPLPLLNLSLSTRTGSGLGFHLCVSPPTPATTSTPCTRRHVVAVDRHRSPLPSVAPLSLDWVRVVRVWGWGRTKETREPRGSGFHPKKMKAEENKSPLPLCFILFYFCDAILIIYVPKRN